MSTSISQHSPNSSPLGGSLHHHHHHNQHHHHQHTSTPRVSNSRSSNTNLPIHTPRPSSISRHSALNDQGSMDTSPNYFNLTIDSAKSCQSSAGGIHVRSNFSPPSSRVRSTAAISPRIMPLDQNPEFAEFRRQTELRSLQNGPLNFQFPQDASAKNSPFNGPQSTVNATSPNTKGITPAIGTVLAEEKPPRSPKRTLSSPYSNITDLPRRNSPANFTEREAALAPHGLHFAQAGIDSSLPSRSNIIPTMASAHAETIPGVSVSSGSEGVDGSPFISPSHLVTLLQSHEEEILLLDLRVATQYTRAKIHGALNLCIPTTLLKRSSYNTDKLADTFNSSKEQRNKFQRWRSCQYIVVYDANASKERDASVCLSMLKKFAAEGWTRSSYIVRGGFMEFARQFPQLIEHDGHNAANMNSPVSGAAAPTHSLAPVIGGCPMPATKNAANPFFGNIRQNMDLIGGVGQMSIKKPGSMSEQQLEDLPSWLRRASEDSDKGKTASDKFLQIEKEEQKRMQDALSGNVSYGSPTPGSSRVQIAGIEKGSKNRYNNIWPYEHSRVKLEDLPEGACDYVNASHVKANWSQKRYIATQGPIPTTFKDFWNVVWQQDVRAIVMLTAETEGGQVKAHNYWKDRHFGPLHLTFLSEHRASLEPSKIHRHHKDKHSSKSRTSTNSQNPRSTPTSEKPPSSDQPYVIVRRFTLSNDQEPFARMREITQLQYSHWPDFGAPAHPAHLLGLVEQCDSVIRAHHSSSPHATETEEARPILVHCSAGCGRTGTFCTVSSVIDMLRQQKAYRKQRARQHTPMEVDFSHSSGGSSHASRDASDDGDYLESNTSAAGERNWIIRDDIDLVEKAVQDFRLQRLSMVQSLRQYVLCYETVLEWLAENQSPHHA